MSATFRPFVSADADDAVREPVVRAAGVRQWTPGPPAPTRLGRCTVSIMKLGRFAQMDNSRPGNRVRTGLVQQLAIGESVRSVDAPPVSEPSLVL